MFLPSIAVMFIHDLPLHIFHLCYDVLYIYILINDTSKDLLLYKVYLLCHWIWKITDMLYWFYERNLLMGDVSNTTKIFSFLFQKKKNWNKVLGSLLTIACSISSDYFISQCTLDTRMSMYARKMCLTC